MGPTRCLWRGRDDEYSLREAYGIAHFDPPRVAAPESHRRIDHAHPQRPV